jgi:hypothetical protein
MPLRPHARSSMTRNACAFPMQIHISCRRMILNHAKNNNYCMCRCYDMQSIIVFVFGIYILDSLVVTLLFK